MDGHGVISAAHLRDLLARDDVQVRPLNQTGGNARATDHNSSSGGSDDGQRRRLVCRCPPTCPRIRTGLRRRWTRSSVPATGIAPSPGVINRVKCDIDHVQEYDHDNPGEGGHTSPTNSARSAGCTTTSRPSPTAGSTTNTATTMAASSPKSSHPKESGFPGPAETNADLFPSLDHITWHEPTPDLDTAAPSSQPLISESRAAQPDQGQAPPTTSRTRRQPQTTTHHGMAARRTGIPPTPRTPPRNRRRPALLTGRPTSRSAWTCASRDAHRRLDIVGRQQRADGVLASLPAAVDEDDARFGLGWRVLTDLQLDLHRGLAARPE